MNVDDPNWPRASAWLRGEFNGGVAAQLAVVDVPSNCSITPGHCDLAPAAVRKALERFSLYDAENDVDLATLAVADRGECAPENLGAILAKDGCAVLLGGDNAITRPGVRALGVPLDRCGLITFDAHHDLRDTDRGLTNGNPIRALLADGMPGTNIVQIGIQSFANSPAYASIARDAGIRVVTSEAVHRTGIETILAEQLSALAARVDAIYIDLDVDVLDRAFAPACPGSRPGGFAPWMMRRAAWICGNHPMVRAMDIVEVDPTRDVADTTCMAAASFLLAFASGVASRNRA